MENPLPQLGDIIQIKNDTGTYNILINDVTRERAKGKRWNKKKGCWSKTSNFAIFSGSTISGWKKIGEEQKEGR